MFAYFVWGKKVYLQYKHYLASPCVALPDITLLQFTCYYVRLPYIRTSKYHHIISIYPCTHACTYSYMHAYKQAWIMHWKKAREKYKQTYIRLHTSIHPYTWQPDIILKLIHLRQKQGQVHASRHDSKQTSAYIAPHVNGPKSSKIKNSKLERFSFKQQPSGSQSLVTVDTVSLQLAWSAALKEFIWNVRTRKLFWIETEPTLWGHKHGIALHWPLSRCALYSIGDCRGHGDAQERMP